MPERQVYIELVVVNPQVCMFQAFEEDNVFAVLQKQRSVLSDGDDVFAQILAYVIDDFRFRVAINNQGCQIFLQRKIGLAVNNHAVSSRLFAESHR